MTKLEAEIKDEKFIFSYQVGDESHYGTMDVTVDLMSSFINTLNHFQAESWSKDREFEKELAASLWIEKNRDKAKKILGLDND